jgi:hypothetical protein
VDHYGDGARCTLPPSFLGREPGAAATVPGSSLSATLAPSAPRAARAYIASAAVPPAPPRREGPAPGRGALPSRLHHRDVNFGDGVRVGPRNEGVFP